ncbi:hypothetical protein TVAG_295690 [Trichomonas vaginalis G3]|uniref:DUF3447 domain-containing protein n=1 Tax=Trichomonas vaginalis (strain ATCC PRA-98 / G3) TaxID=412133 RepID=A2F236_TRIV3|nr:protein kinase protein [Trichomonas vaginalis G3]EAY01035.1 hypothetical protein TVAG_295690 [Trichomonas vaginalis G3]KAI5488630.1 protein kinase protein [Trichomonas vaginalis G3]|eukprot:XP_001313921.1 hypothetical protein [Trichomonas vaginalis G3]
MNSRLYDELMNKFKNYIDSFNTLYQLKTENEEEIKKIYKNIKTNLIDSNIFSSKEIITVISRIHKYNRRYIKSYFKLAELIHEEYHPKDIESVSSIFHDSYLEDISIDIHGEIAISKAIINDDIISFIMHTESENFDANMTLLQSPLTRNETFSYGISLLELCCFHGAVKCFKLLRTKFQLEITQNCLKYSFLGGNPDIVSECLKEQDPDEECMTYAIISHNIDFVAFLMNEYHITLNLNECIEYYNLQAFFVYLNSTKDFGTCLAVSTQYSLPELCKYLISHGADINSTDSLGSTALHNATRYNRKEIVEFLISEGADVYAINEYKETPLHIAIENNFEDLAELLISHMSYVNTANNIRRTVLHYAAVQNNKLITELLISHGADINAKDSHGETVIQCAIRFHSKEVIEILISHGLSLNEETNIDTSSPDSIELKKLKDNYFDDKSESFLRELLGI